MAYFPDLTIYEYYPSETSMLNVGWLSAEYPFPRGGVPLAFAHELMLLAKSPIHITRGTHLCEFCTPPKDIISISPNYEDVWEMFHCGNGEIHVVDASGTVYAAPALILHYVSEHQYQPPQEFINAVLYQREKRTQHL